MDGSGKPGSPYGVDPDSADAVDDNRVARPHFGGVHGRPHPVGTPQPRSASKSRGMPGPIRTAEFWWTTLYWLKVPSRHMGPVAARSPRQRSAMARQHPLHQVRAPVAQGLATGRVPVARAATRYERANYVVAGDDPGHAEADIRDYLGALVAEDKRKPRGGDTLHDVEV
jgi:hypothetical protein